MSPEKGEREEAGALPFQMYVTVEGLRVLGEFSFNHHFPSHLCSNAGCARRDPSGRTLSFHAQTN